MPHGLSNAMLMEECLTYALSGAYERFAVLGKAAGTSESDEDSKTASEKFLKGLKELKEKLNIPSMEEYGIDRGSYFDVIGKMARDAMNSGSPQNTIKDISEEDIIEIYRRVWMKE